ncbi:MAG: hypothetical protein M3O70_27875 [Actinomycetota bacterium]|nr:hypothetical protein [Actinomycetota bacterium]
MRKLLFAAVTIALLGATAAAADELLTEDLSHATHKQPGNTAVAYPLAENVARVGGDNTSTGGHVVVEGNRLYVGAYGLGMRFFDISDPEKPRLIGQYTPGVRADAVPDAIDFGERNFAVLNGTSRVGVDDRVRTQRSEFLDVTKPADPKLLAHFIGATDGEAHNGDIVDERRRWLPSGGSGANGLRIYDLTPTLTTSPDRCAPAPAENGGDKSDGSGNPCAPRKIYGSKPATSTDPVGEGNPVLLWQSSPYRDGRPVGAPFTHTHDVTVYVDHPVRQPDGTVAARDIALLAEGGSYLNDAGNTGSVFVIDITDPREPVVLNRWLHERGPAHHPIRYHHEAQFLDGDPSVMLVTDEDLHNGCGDAGGAVALRVSDDLTRVTEELSEWFIPADTLAPVCSVHVFSSKGALVFFGSYNAGLQVVDYSEPDQPKQAGYYIAPGTTAWGALYHDGLIYAGDMSRGLDVYELDDELLLKLKLKKLLK